MSILNSEELDRENYKVQASEILVVHLKSVIIFEIIKVNLLKKYTKNYMFWKLSVQTEDLLMLFLNRVYLLQRSC